MTPSCNFKSKLPDFTQLSAALPNRCWHILFCPLLAWVKKIPSTIVEDDHCCLQSLHTNEFNLCTQSINEFNWCHLSSLSPAETIESATLYRSWIGASGSHHVEWIPGSICVHLLQFSVLQSATNNMLCLNVHWHKIMHPTDLRYNLCINMPWVVCKDKLKQYSTQYSTVNFAWNRQSWLQVPAEIGQVTLIYPSIYCNIIQPSDTRQVSLKSFCSSS